jgi:superfamily I DNA/RNA helicase
VLTRRGMNHQVCKKASQFNPGHYSIKVISLHASKGLELPVVSMVGVGHMPAEGEDEGRGSATVLSRG